MPNAQLLRAQIEASLAEKIPSALTPQARAASPVIPTGIREMDLLLRGGLPVGAISEIVGQECSGRTSFALSFVAGMTQEAKVCAWVDASDSLHPESAAALGVDLTRLLWIRCGSYSIQQPAATALPFTHTKTAPRSKSWSRLEQALRVTDLLLQAGGFSCIVLDLGSMQAEYALRVPLATWFRFRAATERSQANFLLLTQHACSKSSAGLVLRFEPRQVLNHESTVFTGVDSQATLERQRFPQSPANVLPLRKQPQNVQTAHWQSQAVWAGRR